MSGTGPISEAMGSVAFKLMQMQPLIPTYTHLLISAVFPIFAGAHASLSRPSSAAKPEKDGKEVEEDEDDDELEEAQQMESLAPSDAIIFPVLAGCTLAGLYFIIKWLQDPELLNKLLNWYFSIFGTFSVAKLIRDSMQVVHSLLFPARYVDSGSEYQVNNKVRRATPISTSTAVASSRSSPLPGILSRISLPERIAAFLWFCRDVPKRKMYLKFYVRQIIRIKAKLTAQDLISVVVATTLVIYYNVVDKPWWLTNMMGFGFTYTALQLMSPTTFATGALILSALFFYDIYFVFFTPMMVTVAKSLDIPIKLLFPRPPEIDEETGAEKEQSHAMLGLGDIVLPGIMIGLALRFDLFLYYLRKQKRQLGSKTDDTKDSTTEIIKEKYVSVSGRWGEHFWTRPKPTIFYPYRKSFNGALKNGPVSFPKIYFTAAMFGYTAGMMITLIAMHISEHAQPALLYLVPGVLLSLLATGLLRREIPIMWDYSEASDSEDVKNEEDSKNDPLKDKSILSTDKQKRQLSRLENSLSDSVELVGMTDDSDGKAESEPIHVTESENQRLQSSFFYVDEDRQMVFLSVTLSPPLFEGSKPENAASISKQAIAANDDSDAMSLDESSSSGSEKAVEPKVLGKPASEPVEKKRRVR